MIKGLGVDIVEIERIKKALNTHNKLCCKLFTPVEREYCSRKAVPQRHYALRFAAKEAVLKALGIGFRGVKWTDIEIRHDDLGKPLVNLTGKAAQKAAELDVGEILLSLSFSRNNAVASAVAVGGNGFERTELHEDS